MLSGVCGKGKMSKGESLRSGGGFAASGGVAFSSGDAGARRDCFPTPRLRSPLPTFQLTDLPTFYRSADMATSTTLSIQGYRDQPVPNRFLRPQGAIDHLAVLLPGFGYTLDMPLFYYAENLLLERGWDILRVEYAYNERPEFQNL